MDAVDLKIIDLLMEDAQTPFCSIAEQLGVGTDTVIRRYRKLKDEGVIHNASVIVNLKKCGYQCHAFFSVSVMAGTDSSSLYEKLIKIPNVLTVASTIGDYDFMLHCIYSDLKDLMRLNREIAGIDGIKYLAVVVLPTATFISTFPSISYYSKATVKTDKKSKRASKQ